MGLLAWVVVCPFFWDYRVAIRGWTWSLDGALEIGGELGVQTLAEMVQGWFFCFFSFNFPGIPKRGIRDRKNGEGKDFV